MTKKTGHKPPGAVRDAIIRTLRSAAEPMGVDDITSGVANLIGPTSPSSVRSYLRLNTPGTFARETRGMYVIATPLRQHIEADAPIHNAEFKTGRCRLLLGDCLEVMRQLKDCSVHAVITDPPYGLQEYTDVQQQKRKTGKGGIWRIPPAFDGHQRSPLPRFTTLTREQLSDLEEFFFVWGRTLIPKLVPGANVVVASNPLLSHILSCALAESGLERRGEIIRLTMTMRGGDRPKHAHEEFREVSVMPRSMWEPWVLFRKPLEGRVQDNLRKWGAGGFRRPSDDKPFGDVIKSSPTRAVEREIAPHPSLKPQSFLRQLVRGVLPLATGIVLDPFAGSGSTLAAAEAIGYSSLGIEKNAEYFDMAASSIHKLAAITVNLD